MSDCTSEQFSNCKAFKHTISVMQVCAHVNYSSDHDSKSSFDVVYSGWIDQSICSININAGIGIRQILSILPSKFSVQPT